MNRTAVRLSLLAGAITWLAIGIAPALALIEGGARLLLEPRWILYLSGYLLFGYLFISDGSCFDLPLVRQRLPAVFRRRPLVLLITLLLSASAALLALPSYLLSGILYVITASYAAHAIGLRGGVVLVVLQSAVIFYAALTTFDDLAAVLVQTLIYSGFQLFALLTSQASLSEAAARAELAQANAELRATQALLADSSRMGERLRISRELHDLIGHHLTALALNLEVASHKSEGEVRGHVDTARSVAKLLLADVRDAVTTLRDDAHIDVGEALRALVGAVPKPAIHLRVPADLRISDPATAQVLIRCVQEVITNTVRHAHADNLWVSIDLGEAGVLIEARDDGRGAEQLTPGNGLRGMRERLEGIGGALDIRVHPGQGFQLSARLPAG